MQILLAKVSLCYEKKLTTLQFIQEKQVNEVKITVNYDGPHVITELGTLGRFVI